MRIKLKIPKQKVKKDKFLFLPRWCAKCRIGIWLERLKDEGTCPNCGEYLWEFKGNAIEEAQILESQEKKVGK